MNKEKFLSPDYKPDKNTREEIENLHKDSQSLSGVKLKFADMKNVNLINADLSNADLTKADFSDASMYGVNLEGSILFKTNFEGANLKSANLRNCELLGADFTNTKQNKIDWDENYHARHILQQTIELTEDTFIAVVIQNYDQEDIIDYTYSTGLFGKDSGDGTWTSIVRV